MTRTSPPPRRRDAAAFFPPLLIPPDAPVYAHQMLVRLDRAIAERAAAEQRQPNGGPREPSDMSVPAVTIIAEKLGLRASGDPRLAVASRMHAHSDGAIAFFLFHYLRLLSEQTDARATGRPVPSQTWAMADWSPAPAPRPGRKADQPARLAAAPAERPKAPAAGGGNITRLRALMAHGS